MVVEGQSLVAQHMGTRYEVALTDIEKLTLLTEKPAISRIAGTGLDSVQKGTFGSGDWGTLTTCIDPRTGPWLVVETAEKDYLFGDSAAGRVEELYRQLASYGE